MNINRIDAMALRLNIKPNTVEACEMVILEGSTAYAAEMTVYGKRMGTIGKACKRLRDELEYCEKIMAL